MWQRGNANSCKREEILIAWQEGLACLSAGVVVDVALTDWLQQKERAVTAIVQAWSVSGGSRTMATIAISTRRTWDQDTEGTACGGPRSRFRRDSCMAGLRALGPGLKAPARAYQARLTATLKMTASTLPPTTHCSTTWWNYLEKYHIFQFDVLFNSVAWHLGVILNLI